nr:helix-turn-helix domain-containing protein [Methylobacterium sp. OTU13CASTA1]
MNAPEDSNGLREALAKTAAANLKRRRSELGFSLQDVAAAAGLTKAHVWGIESGGTANPSLGTIVGLAKALRMSVVEFLGLDGAAEAEITRLKEGMEARERANDRLTEMVEKLVLNASVGRVPLAIISAANNLLATLSQEQP